MKKLIASGILLIGLAAPLAASAQYYGSNSSMPIFSGFPYVLGNIVNPGNNYGWGYIPSYGGGYGGYGGYGGGYGSNYGYGMGYGGSYQQPYMMGYGGYGGSIGSMMGGYNTYGNYGGYYR